MKPDYRSSLGWTVCLFLFFITGCATQATEEGQAKDLAIIESWSGDFPVADLVVLPEGQSESHAGYIDDQKAFAAVWRAFKPGEKIPTVDFKRNLVVFSRNVDFYNRTQILKVTLNGGGAEILAMEEIPRKAVAVFEHSRVHFEAELAWTCSLLTEIEQESFP